MNDDDVIRVMKLRPTVNPQTKFLVTLLFWKILEDDRHTRCRKRFSLKHHICEEVQRVESVSSNVYIKFIFSILQGCSGVGTAFPYLFALATLLEVEYASLKLVGWVRHLLEGNGVPTPLFLALYPCYTRFSTAFGMSRVVYCAKHG